MANGTWVLAGNLRTTILSRMGGVLQDPAIGGENRDSLVALVWLNPDGARQHATGLARTASAKNLAVDPGVHHYIHRAGSCDRISAVAIQTELPSLAAGETTDKAYINQRAVLKNRADIVDLLYAAAPSSHIIRLS